LARPPKRQPCRITQAADAKGDADMPSQAMQDAIACLRDRQRANARQAPPALEQRRAAFTPRDRLHPVPDDVLVPELTTPRPEGLRW
jgi:hypothetical protein